MTAHDIVICRSNEGYAASLEPLKLYRALPDAQAQARGMLRVIDESGEDYLYPAELFVPIELPEATRAALHLAA